MIKNDVFLKPSVGDQVLVEIVNQTSQIGLEFMEQINFADLLLPVAFFEVDFLGGAFTSMQGSSELQDLCVTVLWLSFASFRRGSQCAIQVGL